MKLKNKFIPILTIAATASVAAPLVTLASCGDKSVHTYDFVKDGFEWSAPTTQGTKLNSTTATTSFYKACQQHSEIFEQEILQTAYAKYLQEYVRLAKLGKDNEITEAKVQITNPVIGTTTIYYPGENPVTYPTVSFKQTITTKEHIETTKSGPKNAGVTLYTETEVTETREFRNVPFMAYVDEYTDYINNKIYDKWFVGIKGMIQKNQAYIFQYMTDEWGIDVEATTVTTTWTSETEGSKQETSVTNKFNVNTYNKMVQIINGYNSGAGYYKDVVEHLSYDFCSNYLWLTTAANEIVVGDTLSLSIPFDTAKTIDVTINGFMFENTPSIETLDNWQLNLTKDLDLSIILTSTKEQEKSGYELHIDKNAKLIPQYVYKDDAVWTYAYIKAQIKIPESGTALKETDKGSPLMFKMPRTLSVKNGTEELEVLTNSVGAVYGRVAYGIQGYGLLYGKNTLGLIDPFANKRQGSKDSDLKTYGYGTFKSTTGGTATYYCIAKEANPVPAAAIKEAMDPTQIEEGIQYGTVFTIYDATGKEVKPDELPADTYEFAPYSTVYVEDADSTKSATYEYTIDLKGAKFTVAK